MIATLLFPLFSTDLSHAGYPLIASFNMSVTSFAFLYLCIITGRDDRFDGHALSHRRIRQKPVDMPSVIDAIAVTTCDRRIDLAQQRFDLAGIIRIGRRQLMNDDFLRICIDAQVQLAPGPSSGPAVFADPLLAFPIHFQSSRIDDQMHRLAGRFYRHRYRQATLTTRQRRIGRGIKQFIQSHPDQQRLDKALRFKQGQRATDAASTPFQSSDPNRYT